MEANVTTQTRTLPRPVVMKRMRFYYVNAEERSRLEALIQRMLKNSSVDLLAEVKSLLPIEKRNNTSVRKYVEGLFYVAERLWTIGVEKGKEAYGPDFSRENLLRITKTLPMSHYRYLTGSREPMNVLLTRDDALQDPPTAIVKLTNDIASLLEFIQGISH